MADDFKEIEKWIEKSSQKTIDKIKRCLIAGGNAIQGKARQKVAVNTGHLRQSIISTSNFEKGELSVTIGPTLGYGAFIEFGTMPHRGSDGHKEFVEGIKRWAFLHNLPWYPVYRSIVKKGTNPRPYLIPAYNQVAPKVEAKLEQILQETGA
jgi:HK97 gp10 family phage protein